MCWFFTHHIYELSLLVRPCISLRNFTHHKLNFPLLMCSCIMLVRLTDMNCCHISHQVRGFFLIVRQPRFSILLTGFFCQDNLVHERTKTEDSYIWYVKFFCILRERTIAVFSSLWCAINHIACCKCKGPGPKNGIPSHILLIHGWKLTRIKTKSGPSPGIGSIKNKKGAPYELSER